MADPLIPFKLLPEIPLDFLMKVPGLGSLFDKAHPPSIKPFGALVALGVYAGAIVARRRAEERKLDKAKVGDFIFWVVAAGFVGGHILDAVFYHPEHINRDPLYLLRLWDGLSSYGGFIGALIGAWAWRWSRNEKILKYGDVICSALPIGWVFGRAGCAVVHDHLGAPSDLWFAVQVPTAVPGVFEGRLDLGLIECALTIPLAVAFAILWRRDPFRPSGFYAGWMSIAYAPVRFFLDFFRQDPKENAFVGDPRYGGLTPAQWACFGLLGLGIWFLRMSSKGPRTEPKEEPAEQNVADADDVASATEPASREGPERAPDGPERPKNKEGEES